MKLINNMGNKFLFTKELFKWILLLKNEDYIVITPTTKISDFF